FPQGPSGASASAYQSSPNADGLPKFSMKTVTQRFRYAFQAIEPVCGFTGLPSPAESRLSGGFRTSQVERSSQASNVAGQRSAGNGLPNSTHFLLPSSQNAGWPCGTGGGFSGPPAFVHRTRWRSKPEVSSFQTQRPHS